MKVFYPLIPINRDEEGMLVIHSSSSNDGPPSKPSVVPCGRKIYERETSLESLNPSDVFALHKARIEFLYRRRVVEKEVRCRRRVVEEVRWRRKVVEEEGWRVSRRGAIGRKEEEVGGGRCCEGRRDG
ncbi:hypothetical protein Tco_1198392 [Tanacetum coccineum]